jgi:hypothetical protein
MFAVVYEGHVHRPSSFAPPLIGPAGTLGTRAVEIMNSIIIRYTTNSMAQSGLELHRQLGAF